jgi:hypothetical protein
MDYVVKLEKHIECEKCKIREEEEAQKNLKISHV